MKYRRLNNLMLCGIFVCGMILAILFSSCYTQLVPYRVVQTTEDYEYDYYPYEYSSPVFIYVGYSHYKYHSRYYDPFFSIFFSGHHYGYYGSRYSNPHGYGHYYSKTAVRSAPKKQRTFTRRGRRVSDFGYERSTVTKGSGTSNLKKKSTTIKRRKRKSEPSKQKRRIRKRNDQGDEKNIKRQKRKSESNNQGDEKNIKRRKSRK